MTHKCPTHGKPIAESKELELANETRIVYKCGCVDYHDMGVYG